MVLLRLHVSLRYWASHSTDPVSIRTRLIAGLEYSVDTALPDVTVWRDLEIFAKECLPELAAAADLNLVAHPNDDAVVCPTGVLGRCNLAVGPEGGFIDAEVETLVAHGFAPLSLGPRILPVETAVHVLLGKLCF